MWCRVLQSVAVCAAALLSDAPGAGVDVLRRSVLHCVAACCSVT